MGMFESKAKRAARVEKVTAEETFYYPAVADTDEAVAAKLYALAGRVSDRELAANWRRTADWIKAGVVDPDIRRDYATGTRWPRAYRSNACILDAERS